MTSCGVRSAPLSWWTPAGWLTASPPWTSSKTAGCPTWSESIALMACSATVLRTSGKRWLSGLRYRSSRVTPVSGNRPRTPLSRWSSTPCGSRWRLPRDRRVGRVRSVTGHEVRARPPSGRLDGSSDVTARHELTTHSSAAGPGFAMFGAGGAALRHRGGCWRLKDWRLRTKLTAVLLVPLLLAGVLGALRVTDLVSNARGFAALSNQIRFAQQLGGVVYELQGERYRVAAMQASGGTADRVGMAAQGRRVDFAVSSLRAAQRVGETSPAAALSRLSGLPALRSATSRTNVVPSNVAARAAVVGYSALLGPLLELHRRALDGAPDSLAGQADGIKVLAVAQEKA